MLLRVVFVTSHVAPSGDQVSCDTTMFTSKHQIFSKNWDDLRWKTSNAQMYFTLKELCFYKSLKGCIHIIEVPDLFITGTSLCPYNKAYLTETLYSGKEGNFSPFRAAQRMGPGSSKCRSALRLVTTPDSSSIVAKLLWKRTPHMHHWPNVSLTT